VNDLVSLYNGQPMVDSLKISEKFGKVHGDVLRSIRELECSDEFRVCNFAESTFINKQGREYPCSMMTKDGFAFLCMGFTGKKAAAWKEKYIKAFNQMEKSLLRKSDDLQWKQARLQSKEARKDFTEGVGSFVEYAKEQGSRSAGRYYTNITKMEYAALELLQFSEKVPDRFRDTLDAMELSFLMTAEHVAKNALLQGIEDGLHYKEIYLIAKDKVYAFAKTVRLPKLSKK